MVYRGTIRNGVVVLEPAAAIPEGAAVLVHPLAEPKWLRHAGTLSEADARGMLKAIEDGCENVDPEVRV